MVSEERIHARRSAPAQRPARFLGGVALRESHGRAGSRPAARRTLASGRDRRDRGEAGPGAYPSPSGRGRRPFGTRARHARSRAPRSTPRRSGTAPARRGGPRETSGQAPRIPARPVPARPCSSSPWRDRRGRGRWAIPVRGREPPPSCPSWRDAGTPRSPGAPGPPLSARREAERPSPPALGPRRPAEPWAPRPALPSFSRPAVWGSASPFSSRPAAWGSATPSSSWPAARRPCAGPPPGRPCSHARGRASVGRAARFWGCAQPRASPAA